MLITIKSKLIIEKKQQNSIIIYIFEMTLLFFFTLNRYIEHIHYYVNILGMIFKLIRFIPILKGYL